MITVDVNFVKFTNGEKSLQVKYLRMGNFTVTDYPIGLQCQMACITAMDIELECRQKRNMPVVDETSVVKWVGYDQLLHCRVP